MKVWPLLLLAGCTQIAPTEVTIKGGTFTPGNDASYPEEKSGPPVTVVAFQIDTHEVTNAQFAAFVSATGYKTLAERGAAGNPAVPKEQQVPGGAVFIMPAPGVKPGWQFVPGASWRHPDGPSGSIDGKDSDPVVQIAYADALAYALWQGRDLPTEAEWEWAARSKAGPASRDRPMANGTPSANSWDGPFPIRNTGDDGFLSRAPVGNFPPNANGLFDMAGNVWEWTKDAWRPDHQESKTDPRGHVIKGGSFLCAQNFCARYRPESRQFAEVDLGTSHIGFRTVKRFSK